MVFLLGEIGAENKDRDGIPRFKDDKEKKEIFANLISHGVDLEDYQAEGVIRKLFDHKDAEYLLTLP